MSLWGRRVLGGQSDSFRLVLGHEVRHAVIPSAPQYSVHISVEDGEVYDNVAMAWTEDEREPVVLGRLAVARQEERLFEEHVRLRLHHVSPEHPDSGIISAASPSGSMRVSLEVRRSIIKLRFLDLQRVTNYNTSEPALLPTLLADISLESVQRLKCSEGMVPLWDIGSFHRWQSLTAVNLGSCGLTVLPGMVGGLGGLVELRLSDNKLTSLAREIGLLRNLRVLVADNNQLTTLPMELKECSQLRALSVENNRISKLVLDLRALKELHTLQLFGNQLEYLPELAPCFQLRYLSLANVRISADRAMAEWHVNVTPLASYISRAHDLTQLCSLFFRRSSGNHPLVAGALGFLAEDEGNCRFISQYEGAIPQLILMGLTDNEVVVEQACKVIGLLGRQDAATATLIVESDVLSTMLGLVLSCSHRSQLCGLRTLATLALSSDEIAVQLLTPALTQHLQEVLKISSGDVLALALELLGNLAFSPINRASLLATDGIRELLARLASAEPSSEKPLVRVGAIRALAILGENDAVCKAVGRKPITGRGVRILSMDGGGMKGIATLRLLKQLEERTGCRIHELFDLIAGTSTGGILATALAVRQATLLECEEIYRVLGAKVFSAPATKAPEVEGWRDSLYRAIKSGQQSMRVAVYGCKHDAAMFEVLLKEYCKYGPETGLLGDAFIDTACLDAPKVCVVSSLVSVTPAQAFIHRNYEHPSGSEGLAKRIKAPSYGGSKHSVWQGVRASSAAPYYLEDFTCGEHRFQDGAATANNPAMLAIQEARLLWPDIPIDCVVSLGSGEMPVAPRERSMSAYFDTGSVLIESATDVEKVDAALCCLTQLIPQLQYFRFNPMDVRCGMDLDSIEPLEWANLEAATDDFIERSQSQLDACAALLISGHPHGTPLVKQETHMTRIGLRRSVMVVECPRNQNPEYGTCVEAVSRALQQLPECTARCRLDVPADATATDAAPPSPVEAISACIAQRGLDVGMLHLALHGSTDGPVLAWQSEVLAIAEPGVVAQALLESASQWEMASRPASLRELCAMQPTFAAHGRCMTLLSEQMHLVGGSSVSAYLFRSTRPAIGLTAKQARLMPGAWDSRVVTTTAPLPDDLVLALLECGAKAVLCLAQHEVAVPAEVAITFFNALYHHFLHDVPLFQAINRAESAAPEAFAAYACWHIVEGVPALLSVHRPEAAISVLSSVEC